jgi:hypothetical protein
MERVTLGWTPARLATRACLISARLAISVARGLYYLGLLTPGIATLTFHISSDLERTSMRIWRSLRVHRRESQ